MDLSFRPHYVLGSTPPLSNMTTSVKGGLLVPPIWNLLEPQSPMTLRARNGLDLLFYILHFKCKLCIGRDLLVEFI